MRDHDELLATLRRIDGRGYRAYGDLRGPWDLSAPFREREPGSSPDGARPCVLQVDHVQGDPFASPSRVRLQIAPQAAALPPAWHEGADRALALRDLLARQLDRACRAGASRRRGTGHSGEVAVDAPGQEVLETSAVIIRPGGGLEARLTVGLPARGRRIAGGEAAAVLLEALPALAADALVAAALDHQAVWRHVVTVEDAATLRRRLPDLGLVAFLADGAVLPRRSGVDQRPLPAAAAVPLRSPRSLRVTVDLPHAGTVTGMGIPRGVTLIVGGGYHGKSTLLRAIERGVYDHVPADGRELVVTDPAAMKIRAEDGRRVEAVDISGFIGELPGGRTTTAFRSDDASGSTSQAAAIMEALEAGATALLMDEDTSATNILIRDARMQALVAPEHEPITPFVDRVRQLFTGRGISTVLVLGGSGDYLDVADTVIAMREFVPHEVTAEARRVAADHPTRRANEAPGPLTAPRARHPDPASLDPRRGRHAVRTAARGVRAIAFGRQEIELGALEQLVHPGQARAIGEALVLVRELCAREGASVSAALATVAGRIAAEGLDLLARREPRGDLAGFRSLELAGALDRLRSLVIRDPR